MKTNKPAVTFVFNPPFESVDALETYVNEHWNSATFYHRTRRNADGTPQRWRQNGKLRRWMRDRTRMYLPIKHGMYDTNAVESLETFNSYLSWGYTTEES